MTMYKLTAARTGGDMTKAREAGLAVLASVNYRHAEKQGLSTAWDIYREQALGIQAEHREAEERVAAMKAFHDDVLSEITSQVLADIAHGLGLGRWDKDGKEGVSKDKANAISRASNYQARINRAWKAGLVIGDDWSASKANKAAQDAENAANEKANAGKPLPVHKALENAGAGLANCAKLASAEDSKLEAGPMAALAEAIGNFNRILAEAARGNVTAEAIDELAAYLYESRVVLVGEDAPATTEASASEETEQGASLAPIPAIGEATEAEERVAA